jgi:hypothetical protein
MKRETVASCAAAREFATQQADLLAELEARASGAFALPAGVI